jgi:arsenate reductase
MREEATQARISSQRSKHVDEFAGEPFDAVITVCDGARDTCPVFLGAAKRFHWSFENPGHVKGSPKERARAFGRTRDQIRAKFQKSANDIAV